MRSVSQMVTVVAVGCRARPGFVGGETGDQTLQGMHLCLPFHLLSCAAELVQAVLVVLLSTMTECLFFLRADSRRIPLF